MKSKFYFTFVSLLMVVIITACGAAPTVVPPTSAPPTPLSQLPGMPIPPEVMPDAGTILKAGLYRAPDGFAIPFTFEIAQDWQVYAFPTDFGLLRGKNSIDHANVWLTFFPLPEGFQLDEVMTGLKATEKIESGETIEVTYQGFRALQFEAQAQPNPGNKGGEVEPGTIGFKILGDLLGPGNSGPGDQWWSESAQAQFRFTFVEVSGKPLFIYFEAPQDEYESLIPEVDQILNRIDFGQQ
jgi:hypothetical protein